MSPTASAGARRVTIGVDFGTESGRVLLLDVGSGEELAVSEVRYRHGVIDKTLTSSGAELPPDTALQDPADYLEVIFNAIPEALATAKVKPEEVIGLGVDFTCCTVLPVADDGTPLCQLEEWRDHLHSWVKLWKHHSAQQTGSPRWQPPGGRTFSPVTAGAFLLNGISQSSSKYGRKTELSMTP
jgi:L-ribulokinase